MYLVFTRMQADSYYRRFGSLWLCLCDVFRVLMNSLYVCVCILSLVRSYSALMNSLCVCIVFFVRSYSALMNSLCVLILSPVCTLRVCAVDRLASPWLTTRGSEQCELSRTALFFGNSWRANSRNWRVTPAWCPSGEGDGDVRTCPSDLNTAGSWGGVGGLATAPEAKEDAKLGFRRRKERKKEKRIIIISCFLTCLELCQANDTHWHLQGHQGYIKMLLCAA